MISLVSIVGDEVRYVFSRSEQHGMGYDKCGEIFVRSFMHLLRMCWPVD